jgi:uncharacterized protein YeaO (DUF488 family)
MIMFKVKNLFDAVEADDGQRLWVEPVSLTSDLREWCQVDHVLCHLGPTAKLSEWLEEHPDAYEQFRGVYHEALARSPFLLLLKRVAAAAQNENFTLLHQSADPAHNTAVALHEFLSELQAYVPPEE